MGRRVNQPGVKQYRFVKGAPKKGYDSGRGTPHLSGQDLAERTKSAPFTRNAISDKYIRNALNSLVSANARAKESGAMEDISIAQAKKSKLNQLLEDHMHTFKKREYLRNPDGTLMYNEKGRPISKKGGSGGGLGEIEGYTRPTEPRPHQRETGLKETLSNNLKNFINEVLSRENLTKIGKDLKLQERKKEEKGYEDESKPSTKESEHKKAVEEIKKDLGIVDKPKKEKPPVKTEKKSERNTAIDHIKNNSSFIVKHEGMDAIKYGGKYYYVKDLSTEKLKAIVDRIEKLKATSPTERHTKTEETVKQTTKSKEKTVKPDKSKETVKQTKTETVKPDKSKTETTKPEKYTQKYDLSHLKDTGKISAQSKKTEVIEHVKNQMSSKNYDIKISDQGKLSLTLKKNAEENSREKTRLQEKFKKTMDDKIEGFVKAQEYKKPVEPKKSVKIEGFEGMKTQGSVPNPKSSFKTSSTVKTNDQAQAYTKQQAREEKKKMKETEKQVKKDSKQYVKTQKKKIGETKKTVTLKSGKTIKVSPMKEGKVKISVFKPKKGADRSIIYHFNQSSDVTEIKKIGKEKDLLSVRDKFKTDLETGKNVNLSRHSNMEKLRDYVAKGLRMYRDQISSAKKNLVETKKFHKDNLIKYKEIGKKYDYKKNLKESQDYFKSSIKDAQKKIKDLRSLLD